MKIRERDPLALERWMVQQLKVLAAFAGDPGSVPNTHISQLMAACNL